MSTQDCPQLARLVQHLAEAINERKRVESEPSHSAENPSEAEEHMQQALEAIRAHKAEHGCELESAHGNASPTA